MLSNLDFKVVKGAYHHIDADRILFSKNMNVINEFNWDCGNSLLRFDLMQNLLTNQGQLKINDFIVDHYALEGLFQWPKDIILTSNAIIKTSEDTLWAENVFIKTLRLKSED